MELTGLGFSIYRKLLFQYYNCLKILDSQEIFLKVLPPNIKVCPGSGGSASLVVMLNKQFYKTSLSNGLEITAPGF